MPNEFHYEKSANTRWDNISSKEFQLSSFIQIADNAFYI